MLYFFVTPQRMLGIEGHRTGKEHAEKGVKTVWEGVNTYLPLLCQPVPPKRVKCTLCAA